MNTLLQNILVFSALALAVAFSVKKYFFKKTKADKSCGSKEGDCGCH